MDDVVRCRTRAKRWDAGCRYGELGDIFFEFLLNDPFVRHGHHDAKGNKLRTKLKKCAIRSWIVSDSGDFMIPRQLPSPVRCLLLVKRLRT